MCAINLAICLLAYLTHAWIFDRDGLDIPTDFISFWGAGHLAVNGAPSEAFDWDLLKRVQVAKLGHDFDGNFPWHYPPPFLLVASLLSLLPYWAAHLGWVLASIVPYLLVTRAIVGHNFGVLLALAVPMVSMNAMVGQTGFLSAALIGGTLYFLPLRPALAGICLGLLTYKPQLGLLFPLAVLAGGHWRVLVSASLTTIVMVVLSSLAFGTESWFAFFHWLSQSSLVVLSEGQLSWWKLLSIYTAVRYFGGSEQLAWICHFALTGAISVVVAVMWRSRMPYALKAAALSSATLLVTPYIAIYDMVVLTIPIAFLFRIGLRRGFRRYELPTLVAAIGMIALYFTGNPSALGATLLVSALILARAVSWWLQNKASDPVTASAEAPSPT
ncbi:glycosyltransferase family 87 protein [Bradyrhizobium sp. KB893862 SZCCT0404]|uniref:glycosyltransferase family 87 protein n=1 Tax=Bradyrhizobium sp. KB893862 SZCCT0404 TaxID=2807672 RepID=UPI0020113907|nr:glycosyltransferase family 87 protein [Bradyrhizobium sp. KB893862 SZCCT0404]